MKVSLSAALVAAVLLGSSSARAVNVPVPLEGASLNVNVQLQPWIKVAEDATSAGNVGEDFYLRRVRLLAQGNFSKQFLYLIQIDTPNFGKNGDFTTRELIQDAWISYTPMEGMFIDAGMLLLPVERHTLQSTTSYTNFDFHVAMLHSPNTNGLRDNGLSLRGWLFDKKVGYRFGAYEGVRAGAKGTPAAALNPKGTPRLAGFVNFDLIGSEEGAWLYQGLYFDKMVLSVGFGGEYQSGALLNAGGNVTDHSFLSGDIFFDMPMAGDQEVIASATVARNNAGTNSADTGYTGFVDLGYRVGPVQPYVSGEFFSGDSCDSTVTTKCLGNTDDLRIGSVGVNFWIKRNTMHVNTEYAISRSGILGTKHQQTFTVEWSLFY